MIKDLSDAFRTLVISLSLRPLPTILAICIIFMSYLGYRSYDKLETLIVSADEEAARFETQLTNSEIINQAIEGLRTDLSADNVVIRQFHNGRHDLTGIPFISIATTYFVDPQEKEGHEIDTDEPVSAANKSLRKVWKRIDKPECIIINAPVDVSTRRYFKTHEINRAGICPLVNLLNYPIGVMVVGLPEKSTASDEQVLQKTSVIARRVTGYLDNGT